MTTMDVVTHHGGRPANFLEIGGEAYTKARPALELVLDNPRVKCLVVNFCGAFARTDVMTGGVLDAWEALAPSVPVFFSVHGTGSAEARAMLRGRLGVTPYETMDEAISAAVAAAREAGGDPDGDRNGVRSADGGGVQGADRDAGGDLEGTAGPRRRRRIMIVRGDERVLVQGITGKQGTFWTGRMREYGTRIVAGVNPKKAGTVHCGVPVHASAREAMREVGFDVSVLFIPPLGVKAAALDAIEAGCRRLVILTEHIPVQDVMEVLMAARLNGAAIAGPNTAGLVTPGECFVGFMPAFETDIFRPGSVGGGLAKRQSRDADLPQPGAGGIRGIRLHRNRRRSHPRHHHARCGAVARRRRAHRSGGRRRRDRRDDGGGRGGVRAGDAQAGCRLRRGRRVATGEEDGARGGDRDGRQGHLRIEAQGAGRRREWRCSIPRRTSDGRSPRRSAV